MSSSLIAEPRLALFRLLGAAWARAILDRAGQFGQVIGDYAYILVSLMTRSPSFSLRRAWRARNSGPLSSPALAMYSEIASAAAKWVPIVRWWLPFSLMVRVASSPLSPT